MRIRLRLGSGFSIGKSGLRASARGPFGMLIAGLFSLIAIVVIGPFVLLFHWRDRR